MNPFMFFFSEDFLERVFEQQLKVKEKGSYQLTIFDIFPAIISVASGTDEFLRFNSIFLT